MRHVGTLVTLARAGDKVQGEYYCTILYYIITTGGSSLVSATLELNLFYMIITISIRPRRRRPFLQPRLEPNI